MMQHWSNADTVDPTGIATKNLQIPFRTSWMWENSSAVNLRRSTMSCHASRKSRMGDWIVVFVDRQTMITSSASSDSSWSTEIAMPARHCNPRLICTYCICMYPFYPCLWFETIVSCLPDCDHFSSQKLMSTWNKGDDVVPVDPLVDPFERLWWSFIFRWKCLETETTRVQESEWSIRTSNVFIFSVCICYHYHTIPS